MIDLDKCCIIGFDTLCQCINQAKYFLLKPCKTAWFDNVDLVPICEEHWRSPDYLYPAIPIGHLRESNLISKEEALAYAIINETQDI